jgi:orotidine-5'-phosphate decarboxylase
MEAYSRAWLSSEAVFVCDALTVSPYLGLYSLNDTVEIALQNSRGLFILAATSNPEALPIQSSEQNGQSVAASVLSFASSNGKGKLGSVGAVLGATVEFSGLGIDVGVVPSFPVLVPGFGAQGARLSEARELLGAYASVSVCSVSRSVAGDSLNGLEDRVLKAKSELEIGFRE